MAKSLFKKKNFWQKLPQSSKIGLIAFIVVLVGAIAAFALSQTDSSLQSKASLTCDSSCNAACSTIKDLEQQKTCMMKCKNKCDITPPNLPPYCKNFERYSAMAEKRGGLTQFQLNTIKKIAVRQGAITAEEKKLALNSSDQFMSWYQNRCTVNKCQPDWTKVVSQGTREVPQYFKDSDQAEFKRQSTMSKYYWPNACRGMTSSEKACAEKLTALTEEEVYQYTTWLKMGKPTPTNLCSTSIARPTPPPTPIPSGCVFKDVQCVKAPCEPILVCDTTTSTPRPSSSPVSGFCTKDLQICPDGTKVGRSGPNCEFPSCPKPVQTTTSDGPIPGGG